MIYRWRKLELNLIQMGGIGKPVAVLTAAISKTRILAAPIGRSALAASAYADTTSCCRSKPNKGECP
jgi:hypothetical protein